MNMNKKLVEQLSWQDRMEYKIEMMDIESDMIFFEVVKWGILISGMLALHMMVRLGTVRGTNILAYLTVITMMAIIILQLCGRAFKQIVLDKKYLVKYDLKMKGGKQ